MKAISVLGSTGSIGTQTLQIAEEFPEQFKIVALTAGKNLDLVIKQIETHQPEVVSLFVGAITFSGSIVAMAKLQGWLSTPSWTQSKARHFFNIFCAVLALIGGIYLSIDGQNGLFLGSSNNRKGSFA